LLSLTDNADDAAMLQMVQQPGMLVTLKRMFETLTAAAAANSHAIGLAAMLLSQLAASGPQAAEHVAAQPGMLPALALLLGDSSTTTAPRNAWLVFAATGAFSNLCGWGVAARLVAAEPAAVSGLVALLSATCVAVGPDGTQFSAASQARVALMHLAEKGEAAAAQLVLQQPGIVAALAALLQSQHSPQTQEAGLAVLTAFVSVLIADTSDQPAARQVAQQLAQQHGFLQNVLRLLTSSLRGKHDETRFNSMRLLYNLVFYDRATARQVCELPGAVAALVKVLDSKEETEQQMTAGAFTALSAGA
jgi:hypothetical protein